MFRSLHQELIFRPSVDTLLFNKFIFEKDFFLFSINYEGLVSNECERFNGHKQRFLKTVLGGSNNEQQIIRKYLKRNPSIISPRGVGIPPIFFSRSCSFFKGDFRPSVFATGSLNVEFRGGSTFVKSFSST